MNYASYRAYLNKTLFYYQSIINIFMLSEYESWSHDVNL